MKLPVQNRNFPRKSIFFVKLPKKFEILEIDLLKLPEKIETFCEIAYTNRNFSEICPGKLIILMKLPEKKSKFFSPGSTTPQISNQIDAAEEVHSFTHSFRLFL